MMPIDAERGDLIEEFRRDPLGKHSADLIRLLNRLRVDPPGNKLCLVEIESHKAWRLGLLKARGAPVEIVSERVFGSIAEGEWEAFKLRWRRERRAGQSTMRRAEWGRRGGTIPRLLGPALGRARRDDPVHGKLRGHRSHLWRRDRPHARGGRQPRPAGAQDRTVRSARERCL